MYQPIQNHAQPLEIDSDVSLALTSFSLPVTQDHQGKSLREGSVRMVTGVFPGRLLCSIVNGSGAGSALFAELLLFLWSLGMSTDDAVTWRCSSLCTPHASLTRRLVFVFFKHASLDESLWSALRRNLGCMRVGQQVLRADYSRYTGMLSMSSGEEHLVASRGRKLQAPLWVNSERCLQVIKPVGEGVGSCCLSSCSRGSWQGHKLSNKRAAEGTPSALPSSQNASSDGQTAAFLARLTILPRHQATQESFTGCLLRIYSNVFQFKEVVFFNA